MIHRRLPRFDSDQPLVDLQRSLRTIRSADLSPDELLLHSGGPVSDIARASLLMAPAYHRTLLKQPPPIDASEKPSPPSPLNGEIQFPTIPPMIVEVQQWNGKGWITRETRTASNLTEAMRLARLGTIQPTPDELPSLGTVTGLLGYDLVQWTSPVDILYRPNEGTVLGVLYPLDAYIHHNRELDVMTLVSAEDHPWANLPIEETSIIPQKPLEIIHSMNPVSTSDAHHAHQVQRIIESIRGGHLYQANYGRTWSGLTDIHPWGVFERLVEINPAPFSGWLHAPDLDLAIASSSPELLLEMGLDCVSTRPIKGTRPRGMHLEADTAEVTTMLTSRKEIAEHMMLVDLEMNDIRRISRVGSTIWADWRIESLPNVHHMVSTVSGHPASGVDVPSALQHLFPGGSITGCPKDVTIAAISELEEAPRGAWTGSLGYEDPLRSQGVWNILIRTMEAHSTDDGWHAIIKAGGGITAESDPASEVEEAKLKAAALIEACWPKSNLDPLTQPVSAESRIESIRVVDDRTSALLTRLHTDSPRVHRLSNPPRVLFVNNLDSFTWNIVDELRICGAEVIIVSGRGPESNVDIEVLLETHSPTHIVLGPGPSEPTSSPLTMAFARWALDTNSPLPTLGLCLGHQALGIADGWVLKRTPSGAVHGVPMSIEHVSSGLFIHSEDFPTMMRYHSLSITAPKGNTKQKLAANAWVEPTGLIMGVEAIDRPVHGIQFHPESCGSPAGRALLKTFLDLERDASRSILEDSPQASEQQD
ncbi:MAG TPA: hypothetical protein HA330_00100 [Candidatus Thalassarchaeaceae archaeon]|nr:hypothetical protein [Candidatus Thalassarchaeaceae archaeon]